MFPLLKCGPVQSPRAIKDLRIANRSERCKITIFDHSEKHDLKLMDFTFTATFYFGGKKVQTGRRVLEGVKPKTIIN